MKGELGYGSFDATIGVMEAYCMSSTIFPFMSNSGYFNDPVLHRVGGPMSGNELKSSRAAGSGNASKSHGFADAILPRIIEDVRSTLARANFGSTLRLKFGSQMNQRQYQANRVALEEAICDMDGKRIGNGRKVRVQEVLGRHRTREPRLEDALRRQFLELETRLKAGKKCRLAIGSADVITRDSMRMLRQLSRQYGQKLDIRLTGSAESKLALKARFLQVKNQVREEELLEVRRQSKSRQPDKIIGSMVDEPRRSLLGTVSEFLTSAAAMFFSGRQQPKPVPLRYHQILK